MYLTRRFYLMMTVVILVLASGYLWYPAFLVGRWLLLTAVVVTAADIAMLWWHRAITAERHCPERLSNGDDNEVTINVTSAYRFPVHIEVLDELPHGLISHSSSPIPHLAPPISHFSFPISHSSFLISHLAYSLRPTRRGAYTFGLIRVFVSSPVGLVQRRYSCGTPQEVKVYPSFLMLTRYELLAASRHLVDMGIKRIRRIGNHTEFEQIKDYVQGDDYRTINWRATARRHQLMVNVYQDERSQQIISIIDKGRVMQQTFEGMTLLDYAINASLVLSYVAMRKDDKAGLVTFAEHFDTFVPPSRQNGQLQTLLEALYAQQTTFGESDFTALAAYVNQYVSKRSLLVLYTNFLDRIALQRQLPALCQLNSRHRLLVVFFEDVELRDYVRQPAADVEEQFQQLIADKLLYERRLIVQVLKQHGIAALLTPPASLSVNVINKYLELKQSSI